MWPRLSELAFFILSYSVGNAGVVFMNSYLRALFLRVICFDGGEKALPLELLLPNESRLLLF